MKPTRRRLLLGLAGLTFGQAAIAHGEAAPLGGSLQAIRDSGPLRVALYDDFAPFSVRTAQGPKGIDVDLAGLVAERLGLGLELAIVPAGEDVEEDLRDHVWRGSLIGRRAADLMLHVPFSRELQARNDRVLLVAPYFMEAFMVARDRQRLPGAGTLAALEGEPLGVELATLPDYYLSSAQGGRLRETITHYRRPEAALAALKDGRIAAFMGLRSQIEAGLGDVAHRFDYSAMELPGLAVPAWPVGAAVREGAHELGDAVAACVADAVRDGTMRAIFTAHGISYHEPPPT